MNLADMLGYADIQQLTQIAGAYRCECNGHSKHELIQSILQAVGRRDLFDNHIAEMPLEDLRFLQSILFDERNAFSLEELIARVRQSRFESVEARSGGFRPKPEGDDGAAASASDPAAQLMAPAAAERPERVRPAKSAAAAPGGDSSAKPPPKRSRAKAVRPAGEPAAPGPRDTIVRFKHNGWLFNGISGTGRYLFQVPDDLKIRFREALHRKLAVDIIPAEEPRAYRDEHVLMEADLARLLRFAAAEDIPLTQEGIMYRRQLMQLQELFSVREELPARNAWRFGYGRRFKDYPDRLALLYDYAHASRWLEEDGLRLTLTALGKERLETGFDGEPAGIYQFWLRMYRRAVPNLASLIYWIDRLASGWVTSNSLQAALLPFVKPFYYDAPETVFRLRVIGMLIHFGMLSAGEHETLGPVVRITQRGRKLAELAESYRAGLT